MTLLQELARAKEAERRAYAYMRKIEDAIVKAYAQHKVGDIVETNGYYHKGKKMVVHTITFYEGYKCRRGIRYAGPVLKKNGEVGRQYGERTEGIEEDKDA